MSGLVIDTDVRMSTRDGVSLAADVYRPADDGRYPVLLHRTPYDKGNPAFVSALVADPVWLARQGYAVVVQDVRGRFASGGEMTSFAQEYDDGYDAVEWAAQQPWSNGRVGVYGSSYHAITTYQAVAARPPHLRAAAAMIGTADLRRTVRPGGSFELGFMSGYVLGQSLEFLRRHDLPAGDALARLGDPAGTVGTLPVADAVPHDAVPFWTQWTEDDEEHWADPRYRVSPEQVEVPLLSVVGFMDFMQHSMVELFEKVQYDGPHRMIAGPWTHSGTYTGHAGAQDVRATAGGGVGTFGPVLLAWFDRWLRDADTVPPPVARLLDGGRVSYFRSGENRWHTAESWPPGGREVAYALASDGRAGSKGGELRDGGCAGPADEYRYDPLDPVPSHGGMVAAPALCADGVRDRRGVQARDDVLVYTSAPLAEPLAVAGPVTLHVHFGSDAPGTDIVATLSDVAPDGYAGSVSEGVLRLTGLTPEEPVEVDVALHQTAHTFAAGHRLRLEVSSSNFPRLSRNLNSTVSPEAGTAADAVPALSRVHHDEAHRSTLVLHVVAG